MGNGDTGDERQDFIREIVRTDLASGKHLRIVTRFPPEPNGYLHLGHTKAISLNFGIAEEFDGTCHLRFDDTNPVKEELEYIDSIKEDVSWLGFSWGENLFYASDYFEQLFQWAEELVRAGKAYVDDLSADEIRAHRGTLTEPGNAEPLSRPRCRREPGALPVHARRRLSRRRQGAAGQNRHGGGQHQHARSRAVPDPSSAPHPRTGDRWCIYPTYDYAHGQSDAIEHITHSLCTLEFEDHRPLYDWLVDNLPVPSESAPDRVCPPQPQLHRALETRPPSSRQRRPRQRLGRPTDADDCPASVGVGYPPAAIRDFVDRVGVAKRNSVVDLAMLEHCVRTELNRTAERRMGVLRPLKVVIENYPEEATEELEAINNPEDPGAGTRMVGFGRELYIERDDFMEDPPKKFFRLAPGREVRLRYAYFITCREVIKDSTGEVVELRCTYDPETRGGDSPDGRKVKATLHWVSAAARRAG